MTGSAQGKATHSIFVGGGEMGELMQSLDWSQTPIGSVQFWSQSLKSLVKTLLTSRYPMVLTWGAEFTQFYNDAYSQLIGDKHPSALGTDIRETLAEAWDTLGPMIQRVMATGVANWTPALLLVLERASYREESYFSVSYAPAEDDDGQIVGMLAVCSEVTQQILGERRLRLLRDLAAQTGETRSVQDTCQDLMSAIAAHPLDVPFALLYLRESDGRTLTLQGTVGLAADEQICPDAIDLATSHPLWSFAAAASGETVLVEELDRHITVPGGPWNEPVHTALMMPIASSVQTAPLGVLIVGVNPNRALDESYRSFYELLVGQVSVSIRNAQAYEEERRRAEMLAELDRAKTAFFSNVSHEFRTPLTLMLNPLAKVLQRNHLPPVEREQITIAQRNAQRLLKLVNTLLDFSRIEAGRAQAHFEPTDLATYTVDLASLFQSAIEQAGLRLIVDCPPLPELVYVDREMWEKIVLNLLSNAFKFTFVGEITVSLRWKTGEVDAVPPSPHPPTSLSPSVVLEIQDTGTGIPVADLPRLFERFHRVEGARGRTFEGTGIGLSLVQELVHLHGGTIAVESTLGQGSTFRVQLPMNALPASIERDNYHPASNAQPANSVTDSATLYVQEASGWLPKEGNGEWEMGNEEELSDPISYSPLPASSPARIFLVDDNADMRNYLHRILSQFYQVELFVEGSAALNAARVSIPDLVLSDVMMPGMDGFELLRQLRRDPRTREIPILLLSARAGEEAAVEGLSAGADDYLIKPFSARELLARVAVNVDLGRSRQAAARRLEQERDRFLAVGSDLQVITGNDGYFRWVSPTFERLLSWTATEMTSRPWTEFVHPDDIPASELETANLFSGNETFEFENRYRHQDGSYRWLLWNAKPYPAEQIVYGAAVDITQRKQVEVALRESEQQFRTLATTIPQLIWTATPDGSVDYLSHQWADYIGLPPEQLYDWRWQDVVHPEDLPNTLRDWKHSLQMGELLEIKHRFRFRTGEWRWQLVRGTPIKDEAGQITKWVGTCTDIQSEIDAQAALQQSEARLRTVAANLPYGAAFIVDRELRYQLAEGKALEEVGMTSEDLVGKTIWEALDPSLAAIYEPHFRQALDGEPFSWEHHSHDRHYISHGIPLYNNRGEVEAVLAVSYDITDRKQAEAEREQLLQREQTAREVAENANRIKDEFLAVLSHELRSPLNPILGWTKLLKQGNLNLERTISALDIIERNAQLQSQLINDLLDISRILRGKLSLDQSPVDLGVVISSALETVRLAAEAKSLQIETTVPPNSRSILGDAGRLQQVVWNLLSNAVKFTPQGGQITVALTQTDTHAQIQVTDTGKGIHPDFLPYVFEHFRQEDGATTRKFGGLGLGLAIARQIVEMHGGTIAADSPGEGQGTTFTVQLPPAPRSSERSSPELSSDSIGDLTGTRILVVDDEPDSRDFVAFVLEQAGAIVTSVASGIEVLQVIEQSMSDLIVSDIGMPGMDGYMLMQQVRTLERVKHVPAIALTAYAGEVDYQQAMAAGFQMHVSKPVEPEELVRAIARLCGRNSFIEGRGI